MRNFEFVGRRDPITREIFSINDKDQLVRCSSCMNYQFIDTWEHFGKCAFCGNLQFFSPEHSDFLSSTHVRNKRLTLPINAQKSQGHRSKANKNHDWTTTVVPQYRFNRRNINDDTSTVNEQNSERLSANNSFRLRRAFLALIIGVINYGIVFIVYIQIRASVNISLVIFSIIYFIGFVSCLFALVISKMIYEFYYG